LIANQLEICYSFLKVFYITAALYVLYIRNYLLCVACLLVIVLIAEDR